MTKVNHGKVDVSKVAPRIHEAMTVIAKKGKGTFINNVQFFGSFLTTPHQLKSVDFKKPVTESSFLSKSVVIFVVLILKMTTLFERNEDRVTGFLK